MAAFSIGKPIRTRKPKIEVDAGLPAGRHRFRLVVTLADGRRSAPMEQVVVIMKSLSPIGPDVVIRPDPVLRPHRPRRPPIRRRPAPED